MADAPKRKKNWIRKAIKHPGALHRELHVPEGKKIPEAKLEKAKHSSNPTLAKRAQLAETLEGFHHAVKKASAKADRLYGSKSVKRG